MDLADWTFRAKSIFYFYRRRRDKICKVSHASPVSPEVQNHAQKSSKSSGDIIGFGDTYLRKIKYLRKIMS